MKKLLIALCMCSSVMLVGCNDEMIDSLTGKAFEATGKMEELLLDNTAFPNEQSKELVNLGWIADKKNIPTEYRDCPYFNF